MVILVVDPSGALLPVPYSPFPPFYLLLPKLRLCYSWLVPAWIQGRPRFLCMNYGWVWASLFVYTLLPKSGAFRHGSIPKKKLFVRCHAWDDTCVTYTLQAGCPGYYQMKVDCSKSRLLREKFWNLVGGVRSLPTSCFQASSLVLILKKNDRSSIGSGILMIFNLICGVNVLFPRSFNQRRFPCGRCAGTLCSKWS